MKVQHPTIQNICLDVAASTIDDWLAMGWLLMGPPTVPASPTSQAFPTPGDVFSVPPKTLGGQRA